jgi:hypothetical protein
VGFQLGAIAFGENVDLECEHVDETSKRGDARVVRRV